MSSPTSEIEILQLLLSRLERISADSHEAHRASGLRGALLRELEQIEAGRHVDEIHLKVLEEKGFVILQKAARGK